MTQPPMNRLNIGAPEAFEAALADYAECLDTVGARSEDYALLVADIDSSRRRVLDALAALQDAGHCRTSATASLVTTMLASTAAPSLDPESTSAVVES